MSEKFNPRSHIGEVHGIYTIVDMLNEKDKYGHWIYKAVCNECGREKFSHYGGISGPKSVKTKCNHLRANGEPILIKHSWANQRLRAIFSGILRRCYNKSDKSYRWYGAKGIVVCDEWLNHPALFEEWSLQNGYADDLTIDRIDADKDYCPENCQWMPLEENTRKAGKVNWITVSGYTLTGQQWARKLNIGINTINTIVRKYNLEKAKELITAMLKEPPSTKHRKSKQTWLSVYGIQV